jgi:hypothetical protein
LPHAAQNVKEEVGNSAADLAKAIAGGTLNVGEAALKAPDSFVRSSFNTGASLLRCDFKQLSITGIVASSVPKPAMVFGLAG